MKLPLYGLWLVGLLGISGLTYEILSAVCAPRWKLTGSLNVPRISPSLIKLQDGRLLAIGGDFLRAPHDDEIGGTCEIYDPIRGHWSTTGSLVDPHIIGTYRATQTCLLSNGQVLVLTQSLDRSRDDGVRFATSYLAQLYDPATGVWTAIDLNKKCHLDRFYNFAPSSSGLIYFWDKGSQEQPVCVVDPVAQKIVDKVKLPFISAHCSLSNIVPLQNGQMGFDFDDMSVVPDKELIAYYDPASHHLSNFHDCSLGDIYDTGKVIVSNNRAVNIGPEGDVVCDLSDNKSSPSRKVSPPRNNLVTYNVYDKKLVSDEETDPQISYVPLPSGHLLALGGFIGRHSIIENVQNTLFGKVYWQANAFSYGSTQTEVLHPNEPKWYRSAFLQVPRAGAGVALLNNGMVLTAGGDQGGAKYHNATVTCELVSLKVLDL